MVVGEGTTWYVDSSATSGKGTAGDPYGNFKQAFEAAESGDTILAAVCFFFFFSPFFFLLISFF